MVDDEILDGDQGKEDDEANDVVASDNELAESLNDTAGRGGSLIAVEKDTAAARNVERNAEESEKEEQRGKNGELNRLENIQSGEKNNNA